MGNLTSLVLGRRRTATFTYSGTTPKLANVLEGEAARGVTYDAAGNETIVGISTASYTPRNLLGNRDGVSFNYDGRGIRTTTVRATQIASFTLNPATVGGGDPSQGTVTLTGAAPIGGAFVPLSSSSSVVTIPSSVTIPAGQLSITFAIQTQAVLQQTNVIITASFDGFSRSATLTVAPPRLDSAAVSPSSFQGGNQATATVNLVGTAPDGGTAVTLESNTSAAVVPPQITIPAGAHSASVAVESAPVTAATRGILTASAGADVARAVFTILPPSVASFTFSPSSLHGGGAFTTGSLTLDATAPAGGASVLVTAESDAVSLPASVVVPAGTRTATFNVGVFPVESEKVVRVTASYGESAVDGIVRITPPVLTTFDVTPASIVGGETASAHTALDAPAATGGAPVQVTSSDPTIIPAPATIVVPSGATTETASLPTLPVASSTPVVVSATRNGVTRSTTVTVQPPPVTLASLTIVPQSLVGTNTAMGTVVLTDAAPSNAVEVELRSSDPTVASVPSALTIPAGGTSGTFIVNTALVSAVRSVVITATQGVTEKPISLTIKPPAGNYVASLSVTPSFIVGGTSPVGTVKLAQPSNKKADVTLASSSPALLSVPAMVTVKNNDTDAEFSIATASTTISTAVTITASYGGVVQRMSVIVGPANAVTLSSLSIDPPRIIGGTSATGIVRLTGPAPHGGAAVTIEVACSPKTAPSDMRV